MRITTRSINTRNQQIELQLEDRPYKKGVRGFGVRLTWNCKTIRLGVFRTEHRARIYANRTTADLLAGASKIRSYNRWNGLKSPQTRGYIYPDGTEEER